MHLSDEETTRLIPLLKWRAYRFSEDPAVHVAAELLEECARTRTLSSGGLAVARTAITSISKPANVELDIERLRPIFGCSLDTKLSARLHCHREHSILPILSPRAVISIVGAQRSGTSHLYNLLAYYSDWAVLTDASHHLWAPATLDEAKDRFLRNLPEDILLEDATTGKLRLDRSLPGEAENILHRAIPVYRALGGHTYEITTPVHRNTMLLRRAASDHLRYFSSDTLLMKSPFNSFRAAALMDVFPKADWHFIHIFRNRAETAQSIERNRFRYVVSGMPIAAAEAWDLFVGACLQAPPERTLHLSYDDLWKAPATMVDRVFAFLGYRPRVVPRVRGEVFRSAAPKPKRRQASTQLEQRLQALAIGPREPGSGMTVA